jgi:membrane associated rhomboid family serine protease
MYSRIPIVSVTVALFVSTSLVFIAWAKISREVFLSFYPLLLLSSDGIANGYLWQLASYMFLHAGLLHLIHTSLLTAFLGGVVEWRFGKRFFLLLFFAGGIIGGCLHILGSWLIPHYIGFLAGAGAAKCSLFATVALLYWNDNRQGLRLLVRALFILFLIFSFAGLFIADTTSAPAHLGGYLTGFILYPFRELVRPVGTGCF